MASALTAQLLKNEPLVMKTPGGIAVAPPPKIIPSIRRFSLADLNWCGSWLIPRLVEARKQPEQAIAGWLRSLIDSREHLFIAQQNSVALAEMWHTGGFRDPISVRERFVLANGEKHVAEAEAFYDEFARWAKQLGADALYVLECSDVSPDVVRAKLGTLREKKLTYVKMK